MVPPGREYELDVGAYSGASLSVGDEVPAYWDEQRGMFIPIAFGAQWEWGKLDNELFSGGTAVMSVWRGDPLVDSGDDITVSAPPRNLPNLFTTVRI